MRVLVLGANGQVGQEVVLTLQSNGHEVNALAREACDLKNLDLIYPTLNKYDVQCIINCAAYTFVDNAEVEYDLANIINHLAVKKIAQFCVEHELPFIHLSTDYVFDGNKKTYCENDSTIPLNAYGKTKLAGEKAIQEQCNKFIILRLSWIFSSTGNNFVKTILKLAQNKKELRIVNNQKGCPTSTYDIARVINDIITKIAEQRFSAWGIYHYASKGETSWYDFANYILTQAKTLGYKLTINKLIPISSKDYLTKAKRPLHSIFDTTKIENIGIERDYWHNHVEKVIASCLNNLDLVKEPS
jgi:dTDP-4-dehydrorhamnose reductase